MAEKSPSSFVKYNSEYLFHKTGTVNLETVLTATFTAEAKSRFSPCKVCNLAKSVMTWKNKPVTIKDELTCFQ
jgi:hypothetical protein